MKKEYNMEKRIKILFIILIAALITFTSCTTIPIGVTSSTTPLNNKTISSNLGRTEGTDSTWSLFGLWMFGKPDIDAAIKEAVQKKEGDALINVSCYEHTTWYILFSINKVRIVGDAVKFETIKGAEDVEKERNK